MGSKLGNGWVGMALGKIISEALDMCLRCLWDLDWEAEALLEILSDKWQIQFED